MQHQEDLIPTPRRSISALRRSHLPSISIKARSFSLFAKSDSSQLISVTNWSTNSRVQCNQHKWLHGKIVDSLLVSAFLHDRTWHTSMTTWRAYQEPVAPGWHLLYELESSRKAPFVSQMSVPSCDFMSSDLKHVKARQTLTAIARMSPTSSRVISESVSGMCSSGLAGL